MHNTSDFAGVKSSTSGQQRDLRNGSVCLSQKHDKLTTALSSTYQTGVVAAPNVNCGDTFEVREAAATRQVSFADIEVKRRNSVISRAARAQGFTGRGKVCNKRKSPISAIHICY